MRRKWKTLNLDKTKLNKIDKTKLNKISKYVKHLLVDLQKQRLENTIKNLSVNDNTL